MPKAAEMDHMQTRSSLRPSSMPSLPRGFCVSILSYPLIFSLLLWSVNCCITCTVLSCWLHYNILKHAYRLDCSFLFLCGFTVGFPGVPLSVGSPWLTRHFLAPRWITYTLWRVSVMESWVDIGADEVTFNSAGLKNFADDAEKPVVWKQWCGLIERGRPETLLHHRLTCKMSAKRAPGPGAIRKVEWQPLCVSSLACFKVSICLNRQLQSTTLALYQCHHFVAFH